MNNFYIRKNVFETSENSSKKVDYNKFVTSIVTTIPFLILNPSSELGRATVEEYNTKVANKATTTRSKLPEWFCGFQNLDSGELYISNEQNDINNNRNVNKTLSTSISLTAIPPVRYEEDECLSKGQPGSYAYSDCQRSRIDREVSGGDEVGSVFPSYVNWSESFYPSELAQQIISELTALVAEEVNNEVLISQFEALGAAAGAGTNDGGNPPDSTACSDKRFLWKPLGESTKKLVILLPCTYASAREVIIYYDGNKSETGNYTGIHNGGRPHFRYSQPGSFYKTNIKVRETTYGGKWTVENGASRTTI